MTGFSGNLERVDGFPYLSFPTGQVHASASLADKKEFEVVAEKGSKWLARIPGTDEIGWIPKSHCIEILM